MADLAPKVIMNQWIPRYRKIAEDYVARLPRGEIVDLFALLSAPYSARGLAMVLGIEEATDAQIERWSQTLIDAAGNFGMAPAPFKASDQANNEMDALFDSVQTRHKSEQGNSAFAVMLNASDPIAQSQIYANIKIAIGGGVNEPRDAMNTTLYGLLTNPDQMEQVKKNADWDKAFEEAIRWIAPISVSGRVTTQDTEIGGFHIPEGETVLTIQASANRDEAVVQNGEVFDVYREPVPHQSFGNGPHFCMGTHVARRAIAQEMLPILFDRFPNMSLPNCDAVIWKGFGFHGVVNLPVLLT